MRPTLVRLLPELHEALQQEIQEAKRRGGERIWVSNGTPLGRSQTGWLYEFRLESEAFFPDECGVEVEIQNTLVAGTVVTAEGFNVIVDLEDQLSGDLRSGRLIIKLWYILEKLDQRLEALSLGQPPNPAEDLLELLVSSGTAGAYPRFEFPGLNTRQAAAVGRSLREPLLFIWGPPGTGKTTTVGKLVEQQLSSGRRALVLAYSNAALDVAMLAVARHFSPDPQLMAGRILRVGTPRSVEVKHHPWLSSHAALRCRYPSLVAEYERLRDRLTEAKSRGASAALDELRQELRALRDKISALESELALRSEVLGCTLAKAAVDDLATAFGADVVVLDEASMASIPFALLAVAAARRAFVAAGDFMQLPPVVLSDERSARRWLQRHVFDFSGVTESVRRGQRHNLLVQLIEQHRMHPAIRVPVSRVFYGDALKDGPDVVARTTRIAANPPSAGNAVLILDTSKLRPTCPREPERLGTSRFNVAHFLTALAILGTARSRYDSIAYITPFRTQAKLVRRALDDLSWTGPVQASTVHRFQGAEADLVIFDLWTAAGHRALGPLLGGDTWSDAGKLLNVAISRARGKLVLLVELNHTRELLQSHDALYQVLSRLAESGVGGPIDVTWLQRNLSEGYASELASLAPEPLLARGQVNGDGAAAKAEILLNATGDVHPPAWLRGAAERGVQITITGQPLPSAWQRLPSSRLIGYPRTESAMLVDRSVLWGEIAGWSYRLALPDTAMFLADLLRLMPDELRGASLPGSQAFNTKGLRQCPRCKSPMWVDEGKFGPYLKCTSCTYRQNLDSAAALGFLQAGGVTCPQCGALPEVRKALKGFLVRCGRGCGWRQDFTDFV
jgi:hypothetical protein